MIMGNKGRWSDIKRIITDAENAHKKKKKNTTHKALQERGRDAAAGQAAQRGDVKLMLINNFNTLVNAQYLIKRKKCAGTNLQ